MRPTPSSCGCSGFSRSELLRTGAAATAGRGLRAIEPGMPLPAGTGLSRRSFVARSAGMALAVFGAGAMSPRALEAGIEAAQAAGDDRILVSIFCSGGLDSMSLLAPVGDSRYARCARTWRCRRTRRTASARTRGCAGTPAPRRCATCTPRASSP